MVVGSDRAGAGKGFPLTRHMVLSIFRPRIRDELLRVENPMRSILSHSTLSMKLEKPLLEKGPTILNRWLQLVLETYPADTQRFLKKQKDPFANPVRHTLSVGLEKIYQELLKGMDRARVSPPLEDIIRLRAVQDFSPSQAIAFIFRLKSVIREALEEENRDNLLSHELSILESRIDELAMIAFDLYVKCREKIYALSAKEARNQVSRLLRKKGLMAEIPEWEPGLGEGKNAESP